MDHNFTVILHYITSGMRLVVKRSLRTRQGGGGCPRDLWGKSWKAEDLSTRRWVSLRRVYPLIPHSLPRESFHPFFSPARTSIPLRLRAICSHSVEAMMVKSSQAMWHFLPKRSSSAAASSHPRMAPNLDASENHATSCSQNLILPSAACSWVNIFVDSGTTLLLTNQIWRTSL